MELTAFISAHPAAFLHRSAGKKQEFEGHTYTIEELTEERCARASSGQ
jgi:hypothetical protein